MSVVKELLRAENNGTISFGDFSLEKKAKLDDYEFDGDAYKIKTFCEITKLERNGLFVYESVPGTAVENFQVTEEGVAFLVTGKEHAQITLGLEADTNYEVYLENDRIGEMKTNLGGKLSVSVDLSDNADIAVRVVRV